MIVLVRRVRVRPTLIFQGRVEGVAAAAVTSAPASTPAAAANAPKPAAPSGDTFVDRVRNFVANCGRADPNGLFGRIGIAFLARRLRPLAD